ncbi:MAG: hypothetical protein KBG60_03335 [Anaerolineaceae bacterium]|nr:hypothetical protein [Anaerolineaceae bacterium]
MINDASWVSLLVQVPLVGVFIWFTLKMIRLNQDAQARRDEAYLAALDRISEKLELHDLNTREAFGVLIDRKERSEGSGKGK